MIHSSSKSASSIVAGSGSGNLELRINTPKKKRDSSNTGRVPVSGYSLCRCKGTLGGGGVCNGSDSDQ